MEGASLYLTFFPCMKGPPSPLQCWSGLGAVGAIALTIFEANPIDAYDLHPHFQGRVQFMVDKKKLHPQYEIPNATPTFI